MFNLSQNDFIDDENRKNNFSFVGLKTESDGIKFYLPKGFNGFDKSSFEDTKNLFLNLYKIFKKFSQKIIKDRDGSINKNGGFAFQSEENETIVLYSKLNMFDTILDEFDDMDIYSFDIKRRKTDKIDYSKIDKYIDQATFLEDDTIYLDEVEIKKNTLIFDESELVEMFCYIYCDIKKALEDEKDIPIEIQSLSMRFIERHLAHDSSLFAEDSFEITKDILKDRLEIIDRNSLLKDATYDRLYEAIYTFLYGNPFFDGDKDIHWGIDNFAFVWEEMCHHYFFENYKDDILFADTNSFKQTQIGENTCYIKNWFKYPFILNYVEKKEDKIIEKKYLYPDLVVLRSSEKNIEKFLEETSLGLGNIHTHNSWKYDRYHNYIITIYINKIEFDCGVFFVDLKENDNTIKISDNNIYFKKTNKKDYPYNYWVSEIYILKKPLKNIEVFEWKDNYSTAILEKYNNEILNFILVSLNLKSNYKLIIDFKYMSIESLNETINDKVEEDIKKQLLYKLALQSTDTELIIENRFYIPSYSEPTSDTKIPSLHDSDIEVKYLNFNNATISYLEYGNE